MKMHSSYNGLDNIMKVISIVGMTGSGKSQVARLFQEKGYTIVRFGDITDEEVNKRGMPLTEANERLVREQLREEHGMAAYAKLNLPRIDTAGEQADVVIDGLYSWEEYVFLKSQYRDDFSVVAVWASPGTRYARLNGRKIRPLTNEEATSRDYAEIEKVNKGGPIAMADYTIANESSMDDLQEEVTRVLSELRH